MNRMTPALARLLVAGREEKFEPTAEPTAAPTETVRIPQQRRGGGRHVRTRPRTGVRVPRR